MLNCKTTSDLASIIINQGQKGDHSFQCEREQNVRQNWPLMWKCSHSKFRQLVNLGDWFEFAFSAFRHHRHWFHQFIRRHLWIWSYLEISIKYRGGIQRVGNFRQIVWPDSQNNLVFFKIFKKQKKNRIFWVKDAKSEHAIKQMVPWWQRKSWRPPTGEYWPFLIDAI